MDEVWNKLHSSKKWGGYPSEQVIRFVARNYYNTDRHETKILDFGCGAGAHTWYLAREGFDVYAFDGSPYAIENARENLAKENLKADLNVMDGLEAVYTEDFFNAVIDSVCICNNRVGDIKQMYGNIYNMLVPGGKLLTTCFTPKTFGYATGDLIEPGTYANIKEGPLSEMSVHFFEEDELRKLLENVGFKNIIIDILHYTDNGRVVDEYITQAEK